MYYENKKPKKGIFLISFFMLVIIFLFLILILKIDTNMNKINSNYNVEKLSSESEKEKKEEIKEKNIVKEAVDCIVGISKIKQNDSSIFVENSEAKLGLGSGVVITENGYILTNQHVVGDKYSSCFVTLENGEIFNGSVVWTDKNIDLAIVKISTTALKYLELGDSDKIELAEDVYAIGNPIGFEFQRTVTKGIISGINRTLKIENLEESSYMEDLIQTDATINEGNSGGALINEKGELIGINTVKISEAEGIGFAVPINLVKPIIEKLTQTGKFEEAYLGIYGYDKNVIPYLNSNFKIDSGIYIAKVLFDGPLLGAGLIEGDIITKIDGNNIEKMNDLKKYIYSKSPGDIVKLTIRRIRKDYDVDVKLGRKV